MKKPTIILFMRQVGVGGRGFGYNETHFYPSMLSLPGPLYDLTQSSSKPHYFRDHPNSYNFSERAGKSRRGLGH